MCPLLFLQVGAIRPQSAFLAHKAGPVTCMAWHPYQPLLAAGCGDSTATVYAIDQVGQVMPRKGDTRATLFKPTLGQPILSQAP